MTNVDAHRRARQLRQHMTRAEVIFWQNVRRQRLGGFRFRRQHPIGIYIADFACPSHRLVVEIDGGTHNSDEQRAYDLRRRTALAAAGWREQRLSNLAVYHDLDEALGLVLDVLREQSRVLGVGET